PVVAAAPFWQPASLRQKGKPRYDYEQNSTSTEARYFATIVPLMNCLRLVIHGCSLATDEGLIKSVTREGKP
ncbi:hypothetical protein LINPERHAP2_LOCUS38267, partial [Linum perenne]